MTPPVFVINLARSTGRREASSRALDALGIAHTFITAVDGARSDDLPALTIEQPHLGRPLSSGELGCLRSHLSVLDHVIAKQLPLACVLEDDVGYAEDFAGVLSAIGSGPAPAWDVLLLGHHSARHPPAHGVETAVRSRVLTPRRRIARVAEFAMGAYAYVVTTRGAEILREFAEPLRMPMDWVTGYSPADGARLFAVTPPCVTPHGTGAESTTIAGRGGGAAVPPTLRDHARAFGGRLWLRARKLGLFTDSYVKRF